MIPTSFTYAAPTTLTDVLALLGQGGHQVLPADHSVVSGLKQGAFPSATFVSLRNVPGLAAITQEAGRLAVGPSASYADLLQHEAIGQYPALAQALATIQDPHLRHHSTLGGALHHGGGVHAPVVAALLALNATVVVRSPAGTTEVPLHQFVEAGRSVLPAADSLITQVLVAAAPATASQYLALEQSRGHYATHGVAVAGQLADGRVAHLRVVLAGFTAQPLRLAGVEAALLGQPLSVATMADVAEQLSDEPALAGAGATDEGYFLHLAKVLVRRGLAAVGS